ncbi:uncharacterized protein V1510DRAFT_408869 [Dipodascopsis tothii]|uniref:uncharacterized protein n=1 Tax=Dipodascopsis tothii TaxID=44089 RepID=UPI0034CD397F
MATDAYQQQALGGLYDKIKQARVLMVGAGGIGCELLKNLTLTGFGEVHLVDLDTIDLSNLNRQFLFRNEHIKQSKALVAKETASAFNPNVKLVAYHANIKDSQFDIKWFKSFDLVFNALDNLDARRYVNRMCLAADVPLIESGTTGFNGQVQVIIKGKAECYDCNPKEVPKSFPVCTIRSTPSQPIHCIVWAKSYLFGQLFGQDEDESPEVDHTVNAENAKEIANLLVEVQELNKVKETLGTAAFAENVFRKVYKVDIDRLLSMEEAWEHKKKPVPAEYEAVKAARDELTTPGPAVAANDQAVWSLAENYAVFEDAVGRLSARLLALRAAAGADEAPVLEFDKDDEDTLDFVVAAANLRSHVFDIACKSKFEIKQMAGNIIPAIATTNAIVAGLCVLESFKVLAGKPDEARFVFLSRQPERLLVSEPLQAPNTACEVCSIARAFLDVADLTAFTLGDLVDVLRTDLGYGEEISVITSRLLYDVEYDDNLDKSLAALGVADSSFVTVIDEDEADGLRPRVNLELVLLAAPDGPKYRLGDVPEIARKPAPAGPPADSDSDIEPVTGTKRKADEPPADDAKRPRLEIVEIVDDETIEID